MYEIICAMLIVFVLIVLIIVCGDEKNMLNVNKIHEDLKFKPLKYRNYY